MVMIHYMISLLISETGQEIKQLRLMLIRTDNILMPVLVHLILELHERLIVYYDWCQFQFAGIVRTLGFRPDGQDIETETGYGLNASAVVDISDRHRFTFLAGFGEGVAGLRGRIDGVPTPAGGLELEPRSINRRAIRQLCPSVFLPYRSRNLSGSLPKSNEALASGDVSKLNARA